MLKKNSKGLSLFSSNNLYFFYEKISKEDFLKRKQLSFSNSRKIFKEKLSKKVYQYDLQNNLVQIYSSVNEAKRINRFASTSSIAACCRQEIKTAYGYKWSYVPL